MTEQAKEIQTTILGVIPNATVLVADPDGQHFEAVVVSDIFIGMPLVKQHQLVMNALKEQLKGRVHALALKTMTQEKWETMKHHYSR